MSTPGAGSILGSPIIYGNVDYGPTFGKVYRPVTQTRVVTAAGNDTIQPFDITVIYKKTIGAAFSVLLPDLALWMKQPYGGFPLYLKDGKYDSATNPITLTPFAGQTIDGQAGWSIQQNGLFVMLQPLSDLSGWTLL